MKRILSILVLIVLPLIYIQAQVEVSTEKVVIDGKKFYLHNVTQGQTLFSICKAYQISETDIFTNNPDVQNGILKIGQVLKIPVIQELSNDGSHIIYVVKPGDTLYSLCKKYGITEQEFFIINPDIKKNKPLKIDQEIKFPFKIIDDKILDEIKDTANYYYHLIEKGETVYGLTREYNVSKDELILLNPDFDGVQLLVGNVLKIPKKTNALHFTEQHVLDSIANVNYNDSIKATISVCDSSRWFTHGKSFEIAILLPFEKDSNMRNLYNQSSANREQRLYPLTEKIISFYSGSLVAFEKFSSMNISIKVHTYDIGKDNTALASLIENDKLVNADLIIGPAFRSQIDYVNVNLKNDKVLYLLPFVDDADVLEKFERNVTLKPSSAMVIDAVAEFASKDPKNNYLIIQGTKPDQIQIAAKYQEAISAKLGTSQNVRIIQFNGKDLVSVKSMISKDVENVFIMPFNTETSCTNIFLDLFPLKDYEITLIGDKSVIEYETIDPSYFLKVKFSYFSTVSVNYKDANTASFVSKYREAFLFEPDDNAFLAYDAISFFVQNLVKYGNNCNDCLNSDNVFSGIAGTQEYAVKESFAKDSYSNKTVYIFTLQKDYLFQQVFPILVSE